MKFRFPALFTILMAGALTVGAGEPAGMKTMQAALKYRTEMAAAVAGNRETAQTAIERLRSKGAVSGLPLPADADFAEAALDIGHRLIGLERPGAAESFFRAAEEAFDQETKRTPASRGREKARYLERLSMVRGNYLNKADQAKADIDEAIRLQPADKSLEASRSKLARGRAKDAQKTKKN